MKTPATNAGKINEMRYDKEPHIHKVYLIHSTLDNGISFYVLFNPQNMLVLMFTWFENVYFTLMVMY